MERLWKVLDGDVVRTFLSKKGLGYTEEDRDTNIARRRLGDVTSGAGRDGRRRGQRRSRPYEEARRRAREMTEAYAPFIEVYVRASVDECTRRDPKGQSTCRALAGDCARFHGRCRLPMRNPWFLSSTRHGMNDGAQVLRYWDGLFRVAGPRVVRGRWARYAQFFLVAMLLVATGAAFLRTESLRARFGARFGRRGSRSCSPWSAAVPRAIHLSRSGWRSPTSSAVPRSRTTRAGRARQLVAERPATPRAATFFCGTDAKTKQRQVVRDGTYRARVRLDLIEKTYLLPNQIPGQYLASRR